MLFLLDFETNLWYNSIYEKQKQ